MKRPKHEIISFKADASLLESMKGIPNRSEFIRNAILASLDSACPLCGGTGILTPEQKRHLEDFLMEHALEECQECHDLRFTCSHKLERSAGKGILGSCIEKG